MELLKNFLGDIVQEETLSDRYIRTSLTWVLCIYIRKILILKFNFLDTKGMFLASCLEGQKSISGFKTHMYQMLGLYSNRI